MEDDTSPLSPALLALWRDANRKQVEILIAHCQKNQIPIQDYIDQAVLEAVRLYLIEHQNELGNQWIRLQLKSPTFQQAAKTARTLAQLLGISVPELAALTLQLFLPD